MRPRALVLVESELWPCWIAAAARRGVSLTLVSGRTSRNPYLSSYVEYLFQNVEGGDYVYEILVSRWLQVMDLAPYL